MSQSHANTSATSQHDAGLALALLAVSPRLGGLQICGLPGPGRDAVLERAGDLLAGDTTPRRLPLGVGPERLLGGLDLAASLASARNGTGPVLQPGILAQANQGLLIVSMAERQSTQVLSALTAALDTGEVRVERDGFGESHPARFCALMLDEAMGDDEPMDSGLADRLAFRTFSDGYDELPASDFTVDQIAHAAQHLSELTDAAIQTLDQAALAMGIHSLRRVQFAGLAACALAALRGNAAITEQDLGDAARLALLPFALYLPSTDDQPQEPPPQEETQSQDDNESGDTQTPQEQDSIPEEMLIAAAQAVLPPGLLASLVSNRSRQKKGGAGGRSKTRKPATRGRPTGIRRGQAGRGARLNLLATVKAAAPWQRLRGAQPGRLAVRTDDFRVSRFKQKSQLTTVFVVDASGSAAMQRLGEVKGAIELLLADCYVRRDQVALLTFRGNQPELLLPPTRSLARAKRALADLPGGGATPLAGALDAARELASGLARRHHQPVMVLLTDGRGNVGREGTPGHPEAAVHTKDAAADFCLEGFQSLLVDTGRRPQARARELAETMGARYLALPQMDAHSLSSAVQQVSGV
ncbi:MAG: magnesium chelatase subunit D [Lysobacterales bacterium]